MNEVSFKLLVKKWFADFSNETSGKHRNRAKGLSTVAVSNYVHRYSLAHSIDHADSRKCRDARYKFDHSAEQAWAAASDILTPEGRLVEFLSRCGIKSASIISNREFEELTELYNQPGMIERCARWLAEGSSAEALRELWRWEGPRAQVSQEYPTDADSITGMAYDGRPKTAGQAARLPGMVESCRGNYNFYSFARSAEVASDSRRSSRPSSQTKPNCFGTI